LSQHQRRVAQLEERLDDVAAGGEEERPEEDQEKARSQRTQRNALLELVRRGDDNFEFLTNSIFERNVKLREAWLGSSEAGA
jgi:hypothetical protein